MIAIVSKTVGFRLGRSAPFTLMLLIWCGSTGEPGWARTDPTQICDDVADIVSRETGVPSRVLRILTRTETGRRMAGEISPWPWTVNMEGTGNWFDTRDQAQRYVFEHFEYGARSFDIGCFQINYRWHREAFSSIDDMFDPIENARYAARFLKRLYAEFGDWTRAAGAYHSRTQRHAKRYMARYARIETSLTETGNHHSRKGVDSQPNGFPLLNARGENGVRGSLVPLNIPSGVSLFAASNGS